VSLVAVAWGFVHHQGTKRATRPQSQMAKVKSQKWSIVESGHSMGHTALAWFSEDLSRAKRCRFFVRRDQGKSDQPR
jgi:hypothetical protein